MTNAISIGEVGMLNDLKILDMISHNLANAATPAYKRQISVVSGFESLMSGLAPFGEGTPASSGVSLPEIDGVTDVKAGALQRTGAPLDVAIEGDGYFELNSSEGVRYTRQGHFQLDAAGRLVTPSGMYVNGLNGEIRLLSQNPSIDKQGRIWEGEDFITQLKLVNFKDPSKLDKVGGGLYQAQAVPDVVDPEYLAVRQGFLEDSNVNVMSETVKLMEMLRHFETTQQLIKGYDSMLATAIESIAEF